MLKNIFLCFLVLNCCSLQEIIAKPTESHDLCQLKTKYGNLDEADKKLNLATSQLLLREMLLALNNYTITYVTKVKQISSKILNEPTLVQNNSQEVQDFLQKIKKFEEEYMTCKDMYDLFKLAMSFAGLTSEYFKMEETGTLKDESKIILDVLKKYNTNELDKEFENDFVKFMSEFNRKIVEAKDDLEVEKAEGNNNKWLEETKKMKTLEEKMGVLFKHADLL